MTDEREHEISVIVKVTDLYGTIVTVEYEYRDMTWDEVIANLKGAYESHRLRDLSIQRVRKMGGPLMLKPNVEWEEVG